MPPASVKLSIWSTVKSKPDDKPGFSNSNDVPPVWLERNVTYA